MARKTYITVDVDTSVDVDIDDIICDNLEYVFECTDDDDLLEEANKRGIIAGKSKKEFNLEDIRVMLCDKYWVNHFTPWSELLKYLTDEINI